ncbi:MAG: hypothetical protein KGH60_02310 [Candidatus Micrarchaeota archaeon]|nr:hypothetical protein [Candidatus Micrarchaeota archaeon]
MMREIVLPGDLLEEKPVRMENAFVENNKTYAKVLGMYDKEHSSLIALEGVYQPRIDDVVVGIISEVKNKVYEVDLAFFGRCLLIAGKYDRETYKQGDVVEAVIKNIEDRKTIILTDARPLSGGTILQVKPTKIPRIIGKGSTMIRQISDLAKCHVVVGKNGTVWMRGGNVALATEAILTIEREAHLSGLTEKIKRMLEEQKGN